MSKKTQRFIFRHPNLNGTEILTVLWFGISANKKITPEKTFSGQTLHFSESQFNTAKDELGVMSLILGDSDKDVCFDCKYSANQNNPGQKCYTHKFNQLRGFYSMLKSIAKQYPNFCDIPKLPNEVPANISNLIKGNFFRFGTYGEPSNLPLLWIEKITSLAINKTGKSIYTGYTHQWHKIDKNFSRFFRASVDNKFEHELAKGMGYLSYIATKETEAFKGVICPASIRDTNCAVCKGCAGTDGNNKLDFIIKYH